MKITIVVPTYNEKDNISTLLDRIKKVLKTQKEDWEVIIVDDNSQDGTKEIVKKFQKNKYPVEIIVRKNERGLATACLEGFNKAKGELIIVMDADLQHPPEKIPELINAIKQGADIAVASRYIEGGSLGDWGIGRRAVSKGAGGLANLLFPEIKDIKDKESGFFAFKKKVIKKTDLKPKGYKILLEILVLGNFEKAVEVPFEFGKRNAGESKLGIATIFTYLLHLSSLLLHSGKMSKFVKFCLVGLSGVVVNLGLLYFFTTYGLYYLFSGLIAIEASILTNFFLNRAWTFKKEAKNVGLIKALFLDHVTRSIGIIINMVCLYIFTEYFNFYYIISMAIGIIFSTLWNFVGNTKWVWKS